MELKVGTQNSSERNLENKNWN